MLANIKLSPISSEWDYGGPGLYGDPGVQLWVRSRPLVMNNGDTAAGDLDSWQNVSLISGAELSGIARERMQFGSFRVGMKLPDGNGTCAAFFWVRLFSQTLLISAFTSLTYQQYHDNSHELDMEYLSKENFYTNSTINLVMHTPETAENGYDARNTTGFTRHILPFPASKGYHDYRFDWLPDRVEFYVDGTWIAAMTGPGVPQSPGYLMLNHWSNGDAGWSGGPPTEDAKMTVSYVKAYFNSTSEEEEQNFTLRCPFADPGEIWRRTCEVPSQTSPPDPQMGNSSGRTYFFVKDPGHAPGQLIFDGPDKTSAAGGYRPRFGLFTAASTTIGATLSYIIGGIVLIL